jgi:uncharacterized protein (TIGR03437 family)
VATFASNAAYLSSTNPAKPSDVIVAYGVGFGDVTPAILPGVIAGKSNILVNAVTFAFGSTNASSSYAGLAVGFVGLYEFYITVPAGLANGDYQINATQNGIPVPHTLSVTVHN